MNRSDFRRLTEERVADAEILLANGRFNCAYYVAGYAVECALKACIAKRTQDGDLTPVGSSSWQLLMQSRNCANIPQFTSAADCILQQKRVPLFVKQPRQEIDGLFPQRIDTLLESLEIRPHLFFPNREITLNGLGVIGCLLNCLKTGVLPDRFWLWHEVDLAHMNRTDLNVVHHLVSVFTNGRRKGLYAFQTGPCGLNCLLGAT